MKNIAVILAFLSFPYTIYGQSQALYNIPSPEVANLGTYGTIPVSLFTGVPDISIPIYEIKTGDYALPISVSYHISNVKPHSQSGCLGLGWSLIAGGSITRTVRGQMDELADGYGFYSNYSRLKNITETSFKNYTLNNLRASNNAFELAADEFSFNFCGYSGNFYLNPDGGWTVVSDQDIKVEFNPTNDGFIYINTLSERIPTGQWGLQHSCTRFFNKFTLVTPDGARYEFGGLYATEYSIPYYGRDNCSLVPTTWKLAKITTVDKRVIEFEYDTESLMCDLRYVPLRKRLSKLIVEYGTQEYQIGRRGYTGYLLFGADLKAIRSSEEIIKFDYFQDPTYGDRFLSTGALYWNTTGTIRDEPYLAITGDPRNQFHVFMKKIPKSVKDMADLLVKNILGRITVQNATGEGLQSYYFAYQFNNRRKLSRIIQREGVAPLSYSYGAASGGQRIVGVKVPANTSLDSLNSFSFAYNEDQKMPERYVLTATDSWGFYQGGEVKISDTPGFGYKMPLMNYTLAETLKEIEYPTGGKTMFYYELNDYRKTITSGHSVKTNSFNKTCGGLRVSQIINADRNNNIIHNRKYYYTTGKGNIISSGICKGEPVNYMHYVMLRSSKDTAHVQLWSEGGFFPEVTNNNSPNVGYSTVFEETLDADNHSLGYIKYNYSNYDADIYGSSHLDEPFLYSANISGENYPEPFVSNSPERGKLLSKEYYNQDGQIVKKEFYRYKRIADNPLPTAIQQELILCTHPDYFASVSFGWMTKTHTYSYLPYETEIIEYVTPSLTNTQSHSFLYYNENKLLSTDSILTSDGTMIVDRYTYPSDYSTYNWMKDYHILSPVISKTTYHNEGSYTEAKAYTFNTSDPSLPLLSRRFHYYNNSNEVTDFSVISHYPAYGTPKEYTSKGVHHVLLWDSNFQHVVAHIENCTYAELAAAFGTDPRNYLIAHPDADISSNVPQGVLIHRYKYNQYGQLIFKAEPNIPPTYYTFDKIGRLKEVFYYESSQKKIISQYSYQYR